jgi:hypothetical protein
LFTRNKNCFEPYPMKIIPVLFVCAVLFSCVPSKTEIYQWRGDNRKGIFDEKNLLTSWPENGPEEIWYAENIGNGFGSPTVTGKEIFITGETDSVAWLYCFDLNGTLLWKQNSGQEWARHYPSSRSAPTVAGNQVYTCTGMGIVACTTAKPAEVEWSKDMVTDWANPSHARFFGSACYRRRQSILHSRR